MVDSYNCGSVGINYILRTPTKIVDTISWIPTEVQYILDCKHLYVMLFRTWFEYELIILKI